MDAIAATDMMPILSSPLPNFNMAGRGSSMANLDKTAEDFEAVFLSQMLQPMFESVEVDDVFGGGHAEEVVRSMMVQEYGKSLAASSSGSPLNKAIRSEILRKQERRRNPYSSTYTDIRT